MVSDAANQNSGRPDAHLHHAHLMSSDVDRTIAFWTACFGADVVADEALAGSRNVLLDVGGGRLNLYDHAPNERGPVNHLGVHVKDLVATVSRLEDAGWGPRPIKSDGPLSYSMVEGPDGLLIEVFHFDPETTAPNLRPYFDLDDRGSTELGKHHMEPVDGPEITGIGTGVLSSQAIERMARPAAAPLRPPPVDQLDEVQRWRESVHAAWLEGDPNAEACGHRQESIAGVRCLVAGDPFAAGSDGSGRPTILYFHGGGYCLGSPEVALPITERLAQHANIVSLDYRLAPEHAFPAAVDDGVAAFAELAQRSPGQPLVLAGDSAGANLALTVALANPGLVAGLALFSPHLEFRSDVDDTRSDVDSTRTDVDDTRSDVDNTAARWLQQAYLGGRSETGPDITPALGELAALPPTLIQVGSIEHSLGAASRFARRARLAGVDVTLDVWDGMWHTWQYHRDLPEADRALAEAGAFLSSVGWRAQQRAV